MKEINVNRDIRGKQITLSTGFLAKQANGAVLFTMGETQVLGVATMDTSPSKANFFPLSVHYNEKYYAAGRIPGSYFRREGKPLDREVLICRMIDRPLRPLFPQGFRQEVQIIPTVLSIDRVNPPDIAGMNAASAALMVSDIPFNGPVGAVRIGHLRDQFVVNPTMKEMKDSQMDLVVAGTEKAITMIEGNCKEFSEDQILEAIDLAHDVIREIISLQRELQAGAGKIKVEVPLYEIDKDLEKKITQGYRDKLSKALKNADKKQRESDVAAVYLEAEESMAEGLSEENILSIREILHDTEAELVRSDILDHERRADGRKLDEIRPIDCRVDALKNVHGSALFTRGQTQALGVVTLASLRSGQSIDEITGDSKKLFMLHYNFPPYSVGETGRIGPVGRREVGHGMLAERALQFMMPSTEYFPYAIRIVSEILESNGSSSMATVCASSMALMAAGVPVKKPMAGIAMGLVMGENEYKILTDIQGLEDQLGDMDFKVIGTREGITGFQLDIKAEGITREIMQEALGQAREARFQILDKMNAIIKVPRDSVDESAPRMGSVNIPVDRIRNIIGMGGKNIRAIESATGSDIDIGDDGKISIFAKDDNELKKTLELIDYYTGVPRVDHIYEGLVKRITSFGAFVEVLPGTDGLVHISEFADGRIDRIQDYVQEGVKIKVKVLKIDDQGRINLSYKAVNSN